MAPRKTLASQERLRQDLDLMLNAFVAHSHQKVAPGAVKASQQFLTTNDHARLARSTGAVSGTPAQRTWASHVVACRITRRRSNAAQRALPLAVGNRGYADVDGPMRPAAPSERPSYGTPAQRPNASEPCSVERETVAVSKRVVGDYSQQPPSLHNSQLTDLRHPARLEESSLSELKLVEREALYEKVAQRLDEIATEINQKYFSPDQGDVAPVQHHISLAIADLAKEATTSTFNRVVSQWIPRDQPEVQQLALLYQLTAMAMHTAGAGTAQARRISGLCVQYAFDRFADFIADKGGLVSAVEDSDFEVD